MHRIVYFLIFTISLWSLSPEEVLRGRIPSEDKRYGTMLRALRLMQEREVRVVVETGTSRNGLSNCRGDGCSTPIFSTWLREVGAEFYSVDIDPAAIECASKATEGLGNVFYVCGDSVRFLKSFDRTIDFLYLDSYDFDEKNPLPSQLHHLKEIEAAYPFLTERSVVMIDDCALPRGGKGALAINFLQQRGWRILEKSYQVLLVAPSR
jgi:hypothetical protein